MEIDKRIVAETISCEKNLSCLKDDKHKCCKVSNCVNKEVLFIESDEDKYCNYKASFGYSCTCICPTRKEMFIKHGV